MKWGQRTAALGRGSWARNELSHPEAREGRSAIPPAGATRTVTGELAGAAAAAVTRAAVKEKEKRGFTTAGRRASNFGFVDDIATRASHAFKVQNRVYDREKCARVDGGC